MELPEVPMLPPGEDALSATISAVLPTLAAPLAANVATLQAKETMFSGKLGAAQAAYQNSDDAGSQSVGQIVDMLGQMGQQAGQLGQSAGAPAQAIGGQTGMFGSLVQQAMQAAQGGGGGGQSAGGQAASAAGGSGQGTVGAGAPQPPPRDDSVDAKADQPDRMQEPQHHEREPLHHAETDDQAAVKPSGPADSHQGPPVGPSHQPRHTGEDDLGRML